MYQLLNTLEDVSQQWETYNHGLQEVNSALNEAESLLLRYTTASGDLPTFSEQLNKLRVSSSDLYTRYVLLFAPDMCYFCIQDAELYIVKRVVLI